MATASQYLDLTGLNHVIQQLRQAQYVQNTAKAWVPDTANPFIVGAASSVLAAGIKGVIPLACMPAGALERAYVVQTSADRFKLTTNQVQNGDTVIQINGYTTTVTNSDGTQSTKTVASMFLVIDDTKLSTESGYKEYASGTASRALDAYHADQATHAVSADKATSATNATNATNATSAQKLNHNITISLTGGVTGSTTTNLSGSTVNISTVIQNHGSSKVNSLDGYVTSANDDLTPPEALKTTDTLNAALAKLEWYALRCFHTITVGTTSIHGNGTDINGTLKFLAGDNASVSLNGNTIKVSATDQKVQQTNTAQNADYRVILSNGATDTQETKTVNKSTNLRYNPSTSTLTLGGTSSKVTAKTFDGNATSATKATQDGKGNVIDTTYATKKELESGTLTLASIPTATIDQMIAGTWKETA